MSFIRHCIGAVVLLSILPAWSQPAGSTLAELLARAMQNNRELQATRQRIEEARGSLRQAGVTPAVRLDIAAASGRPLGTVGEELFLAGVSREFETAGKRSRRLQVAAKQLALAESEHAERARQLRYEILIRHAEYSSEEQTLRAVDDLLEAYRRDLQLTRERIEKDNAAALEKNQILVELNRAEAQRAVVSGRMEAAHSDISRLVGLASGERWIVTANFDPPTISLEKAVLVRKALDQRPDLRMQRLMQQAREAETALAEAEARPNVTVAAAYTRVSSRFDDQFGFTPSGQLTLLRDHDDILAVGVSVPLFSRKRNLGNIEALVARTKTAQLRAEHLERAVAFEIEAALRRLESSRAALTLLQGQAVALAQKNLEMVLQAYHTGQARLPDLLAEQRRVFDTKLASIEVQAELRRSFADLEKAVGGPIQ